MAAAADNAETLPGDLPDDPVRVREIQSPEFYSLGLVLGAPMQRIDGRQRGNADVSLPPDLTSYRPSTMPGERIPHRWMPGGSSLYDHLGNRYNARDPSRTVSHQ